MNILVVNDTFSVGGAEVYSARLAQALHQEGHNVWLYAIHNRQHINQELLQHNAPDVPLVTFQSIGDRMVERATELFRKLKINFNLREAIAVYHLREFIKKNKIDVAHAHMFTSDYILSLVKSSKVDFVRVSSMHGTHESLFYNYVNQEGVITANAIEKLKKCLSTLNGIIYGTHRNISFLNSELLDQRVTQNIPVKRIYNGFEPQPVKGTISRASLGIKQDDVVFTFIARGIPAKGWPLILEAFKLVNNSKAHLIMIGDNEYVQTLKQQNRSPNIHFVGFQIHANEWIAISDVGLLPSTFTESIPTVIVEFLSQKKPMIVTDVAECANMILADGVLAGVVISLPKDKNGHIQPGFQVDPFLLKNILAQYCDNEELRHQHSELAELAFQKFAMKLCVQQHIKFYHNALKHNMGGSVAKQESCYTRREVKCE